MAESIDEGTREDLQQAVDELKQINTQIQKVAAAKESYEEELAELEQAQELLADVSEETTVHRQLGSGYTMETDRETASDKIADRIESLRNKIERHEQSLVALKDEFAQRRQAFEQRVDEMA